MLFKELVISLIPDEFKSKTVLFDAVQILLDYIEQNNDFSYDISKIFSENNQVIKEALVKAYLENLDDAFIKASNDSNIIAKLTQIYKTIGQVYTQNSVTNIADILNSEYIYTAKEFKQKKGTSPAIAYAYDAIRNSKIQTLDISTDLQDSTFQVLNGTIDNPNAVFSYQVQGSLYKEVYDNAVKPIIHPVGFAYSYTKLTALYFDENVFVTISYPDAIVKVVCTVQGDEVDYSNKTVVDITTTYDSYGHPKRVVTFSDNTVLVSDYNTTVTLQDNNGNILTAFPQYCALFLSYTPKIVTEIVENWGPTVLYSTDKEWIGYVDVPMPVIGSFVISADIGIGGKKYVGFITESGLDVITMLEDYNTYYTYHNSPTPIGDTIVIGDKHTWAIGSSVTDTLVQAETYSTQVEIYETFEIGLL